ncbi:hypothetical protein HLB44_15955 [Aquincola sp. S2]|uniref:Flagellar hook-length control protein FliK n=1 Tax=Pseudaquabacterium terrae TaxID=2732868 RepID=A0ABX2EIP6_9BURK|nr:type III secretion HpaP family protein [Aquabacterium terrae]NRF68489.1 hypothetical protein [Aquabacterium terrae]
MTDDVRRPRRIIEGPPLPATAASRVAAPQSLQADRFQRVLAGVVARTVAESRPLTSLPQPSPAPAAPAPAPAAPPLAAAPAAPAASAPVEAVAEPDEAHEGTGASEQPLPLPIPPYPLPRQDARDGESKGGDFGPPEDWDLDLAKRIAALCRKADPSFTDWQVTIPLDPAVLPETELFLKLSPHRLLLRFHTQSAYSLQLVSRHRERLFPMLEKAMPYAREIDIDLM